ncbi:hypothetical protein BN1708_017923, partial [Verticillium longisporum]
MFLILDTPNRESDAQLAKHVAYVHMHSRHPPVAGEDDVIFSPHEVRSYIAQARTYRPVVTAGVMEYVSKTYVRMREAQRRAEKKGEQVVNQLLTLMDGAEGLSGVYVLAATSRPDLIDPALLRPGRLDKSLLCDLPTLEDRVDILKALSQQVKLDPEMSESDEAWTEIARRCEAFSGADLQGLISNAQLEAIHDVLQDDSHNEPVANGKTNGV